MAEAFQLLPGIEHIVVLMFENRSFDNMLGFLYPQRTRNGEYLGLRGTESNSLDCRTNTPYTVFFGPTAVSTMVTPFPDPGELFSDMNQQIFCPNTPGRYPTMGGFVANYARLNESPKPRPRDIMQCYAPGQKGNIPITSALASQYAVCDQWYASGPVQTLSNRTFLHAATPTTIEKDGQLHAKLNNSDFLEGIFTIGELTATTVFELLDQKFGDGQTNWKIYYHDAAISWLFKYVFDAWLDLFAGNVHNFIFFEEQVKLEGLPKYTFIEPRYTNDIFGIPPNSNHPGPSHVSILDPNGPGSGPPISVCFGEQLLMQVYKILFDNKLLDSTLLIVTYDEHGGLFDHIKPPPAPSPFAPNQVVGFDYSRYGVRVPTFMINNHIRPGTIWPPKPNPAGAKQIDHTSIIRTLIDHFGLKNGSNDFLTPRDQNARPLEGFLDPSFSNPFSPSDLASLDCTVPDDSDAARGSFERPQYHEDPNSLDTVIDRILASPIVQKELAKRRG